MREVEGLRDHIPRIGKYALQSLDGLNDLKAVDRVTGTGLLLALHLNPNIDVMKVERSLRRRGLNVIHGGENALRLTPWFHVGEREIDAICEILREELARW